MINSKSRIIGNYSKRSRQARPPEFYLVVMKLGNAVLPHSLTSSITKKYPVTELAEVI
jgi:hypothetical protein